MKLSGARLIAGTLPLIVSLAGCASSEATTVHEGRVVVGTGSADDRRAIDASNQQIFEIERSGIHSPAASSSSTSTTATQIVPATLQPASP